MSAAIQRRAPTVVSRYALNAANPSRETNLLRASAPMHARIAHGPASNRPNWQRIVGAGRVHTQRRAASTGLPRIGNGARLYLSATALGAKPVGRRVEGSRLTTSSPTRIIPSCATFSVTAARSAFRAIGRRLPMGGASTGSGSGARRSSEIAAKRLAQEVFAFPTTNQGTPK
jgi:hypothetical protein